MNNPLNTSSASISTSIVKKDNSPELSPQRETNKPSNSHLKPLDAAFAIIDLNHITMKEKLNYE